MHSGSKYRCGICNVEYKHRGNYNDHIAGHLDPDSKVCEICNFEWEARRSCLEHKKKKHPELKLDYTLPRVDPTDSETMEMLRKLIDALPRRNGKPNHLEVCMMGVSGAFQGIGLVKKKRITKRKVQKEVKIICKVEIKSEEEEIALVQNGLEDVRKSSRIKERNERKTVVKAPKIPLQVKVKKHKNGIKEEPLLESSTIDDLELTDDNRSYATRKDPALEEYDPNYDYTASEDIFVNDFLQETDMYDPDFDPVKASKFIKTTHKSHSQTSLNDVQKTLKPGEVLCRICTQPTKAIKTHLEHYHSDPLLDRVCRVCKKVRMVFKYLINI